MQPLHRHLHFHNGLDRLVRFRIAVQQVGILNRQETKVPPVLRRENRESIQHIETRNDHQSSAHMECLLPTFCVVQ